MYPEFKEKCQMIAKKSIKRSYKCTSSNINGEFIYGGTFSGEIAVYNIHKSSFLDLQKFNSSAMNCIQRYREGVICGFNDG